MRERFSTNSTPTQSTASLTLNSFVCPLISITGIQPERGMKRQRAPAMLDVRSDHCSEFSTLPDVLRLPGSESEGGLLYPWLISRIITSVTSLRGSTRCPKGHRRPSQRGLIGNITKASAYSARPLRCVILYICTDVHYICTNDSE